MNDQTLSPAFARFFSAPLAQTDPEIAAILGAELARQQDGIELIASENIVSAAVLEAQGSVLTNKYAEGLPGRRYYGGCQEVDRAESLAIARACGLPARYVSGHLLGEGATHAWIEFLLPGRDGGAVALSFDPTYGVPTSLRYVVVAVGRDYGDVAPTSGAYRAPYAGTLDARTHVRVQDVAYR